MSTEGRLVELEVVLPEPPPVSGRYEDAMLAGSCLYLSGKGPRRRDGSRPSGKVGADVTVEEAREHARLTGLNLLAVLKRELGSLDRVKRVVKLFGMVNAAADFVHHPQVIDGCSELMIKVFGEKGRHARSAAGMSSLPGNMTVEIEMIVEITP